MTQCVKYWNIEIITLKQRIRAVFFRPPNVFWCIIRHKCLLEQFHNQWIKHNAVDQKATSASLGGLAPFPPGSAPGYWHGWCVCVQQFASGPLSTWRHWLTVLNWMTSPAATSLSWLADSRKRSSPSTLRYPDSRRSTYSSSGTYRYSYPVHGFIHADVFGGISP